MIVDRKALTSEVARWRLSPKDTQDDDNGLTWNLSIVKIG
jgi:hypothetical protein